MVIHVLNTIPPSAIEQSKYAVTLAHQDEAIVGICVLLKLSERLVVVTPIPKPLSYLALAEHSALLLCITDARDKTFTVTRCNAAVLSFKQADSLAVVSFHPNAPFLKILHKTK